MERKSESERERQRFERDDGEKRMKEQSVFVYVMVKKEIDR